MKSAGPVALAFAALLGPCAACGRDAAPPAPTGPRVLTVAVRADITGVFPNPPTRNEAFTIDLFSNVFEGLFRLDSALAVKPSLASGWETPDERTWLFRLREGVRFSDGTPLTPEDVAASLRAAVERPFPTGAFLSAIASAEAVGPNEVRVTTREPSVVLPAFLTAGYVLPRAALERDPVPPVGSGPYVFVRRVPGREIVLARNPFHEPAAPFDEVRLRIVPGAQERVEALVAGTADIADNVPIDAVDRLSREKGLVVIAQAGIRVLYLAPRVDRPPFSDPRVREALDLAIDRDELNARVYGGRGIPASQPVPVAVAGHDPSLAVVRADRRRARELVLAASGGAGLDVVLDAPSDRYLNDVALAHEAARQMELAGFRVTVRTWPKAEFFPFLETGASGLYLLGWVCDTLDASDVLEGTFRTRSGSRPPNQNYQGLADAELDRLIDAAAATPDVGERLTRLRAAIARLYALRAAVSLVVMPETIAFSSRIAWTPPPTLVLRLHEVRPATGAGPAGRR